MSRLLAFVFTLSLFTIVTQPTDAAVHIPSNVLLVAVGGKNLGAAWQNMANVDIISMASNEHKTAAPMPKKLSEFGSTIVNDTIYTLGGEVRGADRSSTLFNDFLVYHIPTNTWSNLTGFPAGLKNSAVVAHPTNGRVYSLGGYAGGEARKLRACELLTGKSHQKCVVIQFCESLTNTGTTTIYEPTAKRWQRSLTPLPGPDNDNFEDSCAVILGNSIYLNSLMATYRSDDYGITWTRLASDDNDTLAGVLDSACVAVPGKNAFLVIGGSGYGDHGSIVKVFDTNTNKWALLAPLLKPRGQAGVVVVPGGSNAVVVCGGYNSAAFTATYDDCEIYDWDKNQWTMAEFKLNAARRAYGLFATTQSNMF